MAAAAAPAAGALLAFDASSFAAQPQLLDSDTERDHVREAVVDAALACAAATGGGSGGAPGVSLLPLLHDLRCDDLGGALAGVKEGAARPPADY